MGTSTGYGGSAGAKPVRDPIRQWIEGAGGGGPGGGDGNGDPDDIPRPDDVPRPDDERPGWPPRLPAPPPVLKSLAALGSLLAGAGAGARGRGGGGVGGRSTSKAATSGGLAASAGYGSRGGPDQLQAFADHTLRPEELEGLSPMEQAFRIKEAAAPDGEQLDDDEINQANCNFAIWIVEQGPGIAPDDVVRHWVLEYIWVVWQREIGQVLCELDAQQRQNREEQMKAVLENRMALTDIDMDGVTAADFQRAIERALDTLAAIFGTEQP